MLGAALLVAGAACGAWHGGVQGFYPGTVMSNGMKLIDTWIELAPDGRLQGHYVLHEPTRDVPGVLDPVGDEGCGTAVFRWTDLYGTGVARMEFDLGRHCFEGAWGQAVVVSDLVWHACAKEKLTS